MTNPALATAATEFNDAIRRAYIAIANTRELDIVECAQYIEELAALVQLGGGNRVGGWALTLEQTLGESPAPLRQALTQLAHAEALLEALELAEDED